MPFSQFIVYTFYGKTERETQQYFLKNYKIFLPKSVNLKDCQNWNFYTK